MRKRVRRLTPLVLVVGLLTACGSQGQGDEVPAEDVRAEVVRASEQVAQLLLEGGLRVEQGTGQYRACGIEPEPTIEYASSLTVPVEGEVADAVTSTAEALEGAGWELRSSGETPRPYATAEREQLTVSLGESRRTPGEMSVGVSHECVDGELGDLGVNRPETLDLA